MSLAVAIEILRAVNSAADAFPPLKSATGGALYIAECVEKFKRSKEDWKNFADHIQIHVAIIMDHIPKDESKKKDDWTRNLDTLNIELSRIEEKIEDIQSQKGLKGLKKYLSADGDIRELQSNFDRAMRVFQFQSTLTSRSELLKLLQEASGEGVVQRLLSTFKKEIVSEIDWSAAFARLPDPIGTSWNPARACFPGTRAALLSEISLWISAISHSPAGTAEIFLIADALGSGKTALAHAVCQNAHKAGYLVASFFFDRQDAAKSTPRNLFASIIRGLGNVSTQVKTAIAQRLDADSDLATADPIRQLEDLLLPICDILPTHRPLVIVIDALDEGDDEDLVNILRNSIPLLPQTFRVVVTSRPEERIMSRMNGLLHVRRSVISMSGIGNRNDIEKYVNDRLQMAGWGREVSPVLKEKFIVKTEGLFLWAATALNHVNKLHDPCSELQDLIDNTSESWSGGKDAENKLDNLYQQILSSFEWTDAKFVRAYKSVMGAIVTLKEPLSLLGLSSLYATETDFDKDIARICSRMQTFLASFDKCSLDQPIHLLHLSIQEYLTERAPKPYLLDTDEHHFVLASCCLTTIDKELNKETIPQLGYTEGLQDEYHAPGIQKIERRSISEQLWYSCWFLADHISSVQPGASEAPSLSLARMTTTMLSEKAGLLLEITTSMGKVMDLGAIRKWALNIMTLDHENSNNLNDDTIDQELARHLQSLSVWLHKNGRNEEALHAIEYAVETRRNRVESRPNDELACRDLASSLHYLSIHFLSVDRFSDSLSTVEEAVRIRRCLAATQQAKFEADLTLSLNVLSNSLKHVGRYAEALTAIEEAVTIRRRLVSERPAAYEAVLATSLSNLSHHLINFERYPEALIALEEAIVIRRRHLTEKQPDIFKEDLASSLWNLAVTLSNLGRRADALTAIEESVEIYRQLAEMQPAAFDPDFANSLCVHSNCLSDLERHTEALRAAEDVVEIHRRLAASRPTRFNPRLAKALRLLSGCLVTLGRQEDASKVTQEAEAISS